MEFSQKALSLLFALPSIFSVLPVINLMAARNSGQIKFEINLFLSENASSLKEGIL
jgi:hypothetical protein